MISIKKFTFNPFQENSYILYDETKECVIIDPGCYSPTEKATLLNFISDNDLKPVKLLNTHCHVDHIQGNHIVSKTFNLQLINGDVLFQGSFGRFDLPFGDAYVLSKSIQNKIFSLPDDYIVYAGHMGETTIGAERNTNPILQYPTSKPQENGQI